MPQSTFTHRTATRLIVVAFAIACTSKPESTSTTAIEAPRAGSLYTVHDTTINAEFDAGGTAAPVQQAMLSTRLMGSVMAVTAREGDHVAAGQVVLRVDARDLTAKSSQVSAAIAEASALHHDALVQAGRIRALHADSAATRAQLDAAETGLARTQAGLEAAQAAAAELGAVSSYSIVRAPFAGIVTKRFVDPGAFATPGAPLMMIQDVSTLRISASTTPTVAQKLHRGQVLTAQVEGAPVAAIIEGVVPGTTGNLYTVNALVANSHGALLAGSRATLALPTGRRHVLIVPLSAIAHFGDLTGVMLHGDHGDDRRWVRLGRTLGSVVEVTAGLRAADRVVVPAVRVAAATGR